MAYFCKKICCPEPFKIDQSGHADPIRNEQGLKGAVKTDLHKTIKSFLQAIDVWMGACTAFIFAALIEFTIVNYLWRRRKVNKANLGHPMKRPFGTRSDSNADDADQEHQKIELSQVKLYRQYFFKSGHSQPLFLFFRLLNTVDSIQVNVRYKSLPKTGFEPRTSGVGSDCSTN